MESKTIAKWGIVLLSSLSQWGIFPRNKILSSFKPVVQKKEAIKTCKK